MTDTGQRLGERKRFKAGANFNVLAILIAFIIIITIVQATTLSPGQYPTMISTSNILNIMSQVSVTGIMAMGMAMVMIGGGIDLSVGMLTSFVVLHLAKSYIDPLYGEKLTLGSAIFLSILFAVLMETGMGFIISRFNVEPFIITLGGMICFRGVALLVVNSQEISMGGKLEFLKTSLLPVRKNFEWIDMAGLKINFPIYILVFFGITILIWVIMKYTKYGRRIYAVGANRHAAYLAGINVKNIILSTYTINGLLVSLASIFLLARVNTAIIATGQNKEIDVIAAAVIGGVALSGGKGSIWGVFIGAILMGTIENGMNMLRLKAEWQYVAKGLIIIGVVSAGAIVATVQNRSELRRKQQSEALAPAAAE